MKLALQLTVTAILLAIVIPATLTASEAASKIGLERANQMQQIEAMWK